MAAGRRIGGLWIVATLWLSIGACSKGDNSTDEGRDRPGITAGPRGSGSAGSGSPAAGGAATGADTDFGNSDAMAPVLVARDAGEPGVGETTDPDDPMCGGIAVVPEVQTEVIPGNILLIFDKSGSMNDPWTGGANSKWVDAWQAVRDALTPLQDNINVGVIFFPHPAAYTGTDQYESECFVPAPDVAPQMPFMPGPEFLAAWNAFWTPIVNADLENARTPLYEAMQAADALLDASMLQGATRVVVITDGAPNCINDDEALVADQITFLSPSPTAWLMDGIQTHVLGLPGADQPNAVAILNGVAMAGGTNQHISAADPAVLQATLETIIGESVTNGFTTCEIALPNEPPNPEDVHVLVVENGLEQDVGKDLGTGGGWTLADDLTQIVLDGTLCDLALQGQYEKISVVFGCVDAPPLPPPKPPE